MFDSVDPNDAKQLVSNSAFWIIVAWLAREVLSHFRNTKKDLNKSLKENTTEAMKLQMSITELKIQLKAIEDSTKSIPKMQRDIDIAHERLRQLNPSFGRTNS